MYTVTVEDRRDVFHTDNLEFARAVFREWVGHSTNPNSMAFGRHIMMFDPAGLMIQTTV